MNMGKCRVTSKTTNGYKCGDSQFDSYEDRYFEAVDELGRLEDIFEFLKEHQKHTLEDLYDRGYYNGLEFAIAKYENREPNFKDCK